MILSIKGLYATLSITDTQHNNSLHYAECHDDECHILFIFIYCRYAECPYAECHGALTIQLCVEICWSKSLIKIAAVVD
jgi:hypothetical protein